MKEKIEPPRAEAPALQFNAQGLNQLAGVAGDSLGRADRLAEDATRLDDLRRAEWFDRLRGIAKRLVETATDFRTKSQRQGRARLIDKIADPFEPERPQA